MADPVKHTDDQLINLVHATRALGRDGYERVELHFVHVGNYIEACVVSVIAGEQLIDPLPDDVITLVLQRRMAQRETAGAWMSFVLSCWMDGLVEEQANYEDQPVWLVGHPSSDDFELERDRFPRAAGFPAWFEGAELDDPIVPEAFDKLVVRFPKARALSAEVGPDVMRLYHEALVRSLEVQEHVISLVGEHSFELDLHGAGTVTFTQPGVDPLVAQAHILGESDVAAGVWRWVWDQPSKYPDTHATHSAQFLRSYGELNGVPGFIAPTLPLNKVLPAHATALLLLAAAKPVTGAWAHFLAETESGDSIAMLLSHPEFEATRRSLDVAAQYALAAAKHLTVVDHRALVHGYAKHVEDVQCVVHSACDVSWVAREGEARFTFDPAGLITHAEFMAASDSSDDSEDYSEPIAVHVNEVVAERTAGWFGRWFGR